MKAFEEVWPQAQLQNIVDDSLSVDVAVTGLDNKMDRRFSDLAEYARACEVDGILFTCSAFGSSIEKVQSAHGDIPILKPNEAMMEEAATIGGNVGVLSVFEPTVPSIERELQNIAAELGRAEGLQLQVQFVPGALAVLHSGDERWPRTNEGHCPLDPSCWCSLLALQMGSPLILCAVLPYGQGL